MSTWSESFWIWSVVASAAVQSNTSQLSTAPTGRSGDLPYLVIGASNRHLAPPPPRNLLALRRCELGELELPDDVFPAHGPDQAPGFGHGDLRCVGLAHDPESLRDFVSR